jgi:hypothetical protein
LACFLGCQNLTQTTNPVPTVLNATNLPIVIQEEPDVPNPNRQPIEKKKHQNNESVFDIFMQKKHMRPHQDSRTIYDSYPKTNCRGKIKQLATRHYRKSQQKRSRTTANHNPRQKRQPLRPLQRSTSPLWQNPMPNHGKSQLLP